MPDEPRSDTPLLATMIEGLRQDTQRQAMAIAEIQRDVRQQSEQLVTLNKILRGNGDNSQSVVVRMALVERAMSEAAGSLKDMRSVLESRHGEDSRGKWQLLATITTALMALIASIVTALLALKKP